MAAYVIADIETTDEAGYAEYRAVAGAAVAKYGGAFIVRGGTIDYKEGDWRPSRLVVVEFPDLERARACYHSPEYQAAIPLRQRDARTHGLVIVDGVP